MAPGSRQRLKLPDSLGPLAAYSAVRAQEGARPAARLSTAAIGADIGMSLPARITPNTSASAVLLEVLLQRRSVQVARNVGKVRETNGAC